MTPEQLLYSKTHEWVDVEIDAAGTKIATVGLTTFALQSLTDLVFLELPPVGRQVKAQEAFGEIESVKAVSDLYSPVDGEIVQINTELADRLDTLAEESYQTSWLVKIKITDEAALADLLDYAAYQKQCEEETADE